jgi:hypothetical protein
LCEWWLTISACGDARALISASAIDVDVDGDGDGESRNDKLQQTVCSLLICRLAKQEPNDVNNAADAMIKDTTSIAMVLYYCNIGLRQTHIFWPINERTGTGTTTETEIQTK